MNAKRVMFLGISVILTGWVQAGITVLERSAPEEIAAFRDGHTQVFRVRKKLEVTDPVTGEVSISESSSQYVVKGMGLCYRSGGQWLPASPHWVTETGGFASGEANYSLTCGELLASGVILHRDAADACLRPSGIEIVGGGQRELLLPVGDTLGTIKEDDNSCLVFADAYGPGIDLCYRLTPSGLHQDITFAQKPALPDGVAPSEAEVNVLTQIIFEGIDKSRLAVESGSEQLSLGNGAQSTSKVKIAPVNVSAGENSQSLLSFIQSKVTGSGNQKQRVDYAGRSFVCDASGNCYLVESLSYQFFQTAQLPVVWDYHEVSGSITQDEVWEAGTTYWVQGAILVDGATLRMEGGATVKFNPDVGAISLVNGGAVVADGEVLADGEGYPFVGYRNVAYHYVVFTSADDNNCGEDLPNPPLGYPNQYLAISGSGSSSSRVRFCKFSRAYGYQGMVHINDELEAPIEHNVFLYICGRGYSERLL